MSPTTIETLDTITDVLDDALQELSSLADSDRMPPGIGTEVDVQIQRLHGVSSNLEKLAALSAPAGRETWQDIATAPKDGTVIAVVTRDGSVLKVKYEDIGDDNAAWMMAEELDGHPFSWDEGVCWASNSNEEESDPPLFWIPLPPASGEAGR